MERGALQDAKLKDFAKKYVLLLHVTTRVQTDKYQDLLQEKGGRGFPYLVWMDARGDVITTQGDRSVAGFEKTGSKVLRYNEAKLKADKGDEAAKIDLVLSELDFGKIKLAEAKEKLKDAKLSKEQEAWLAEIEVNAEVAELARGARSKEARIEAGKKFREMKRAGRIPTDDGAFQPFYIFMLDLAESEGDAVLFEEALAELKKKYDGLEGTQGFFTNQEKRLEALKKR